MSETILDSSTEIVRLRDISGTQWKSGIAAWLGWFFDGLDLHLFTIVATPFVAQLMAMDEHSNAVRDTSSWIQAAFLIGWALGGGVFGRVGDRLGRSRALMLTILMYAMFTGLSYFAHTWWELLIYRFLAALGIGGEWAVGASMLSETWPAKWRHWVAAVLQTGVNLGILLAMLSGYVLLPLLHLPDRTVFLVGVLPALLVLWIRRAVPEPEEWQAAREIASEEHPPFIELFRGRVLAITVPAVLVCATSLTGHWAFMFWFAQHMRNLADAAGWSATDQSRLPIIGLTITVGVSTIGNFLAGALAGRIGYRPAVVAMCIAYFASMFFAYREPRTIESMWIWLPLIGLCQGVFALFTMYLPPLFPTLLRTTGAGFCYNIGRLAAAFGTVYLGTFGDAGDYQQALYYTSFLFLLAAAFALLLPELPRVRGTVAPLE
ncbi:MAG TPA: MFS transporter [Lacipirellulaceae bacterium]|nr:MFS transporter [Lacipirellulaceae bacterium]